MGANQDRKIARTQGLIPDPGCAALALRQQVRDMKLDTKPAWINNQQDWPDVYGLPLENLFGVFGTTWYYKLDLPGVKEFVERYQQMYPDTRMRVPGNVFYNGYMATRELLSAVERAGTTNNHAVIKELEKLQVSAEDRMQHLRNLRLLERLAELAVAADHCRRE